MTWLALVRHGAAEWNENGLVQGHSDVPLSDRGRAEVARWRLPPALGGFALVSSPLARAVETARLIAGEPEIEPRLIEMSWGAWEGRTLPDLRAELGDLMAAWEAKGLTSAAQRFDYYYKQGELEEWVPKIQMMAQNAACIAVNPMIRNPTRTTRASSRCHPRRMTAPKRGNCSLGILAMSCLSASRCTMK